ncbi:MAG: sensor signal transduction histidine kinase, partial [Polaromonas sp.]|nr:sensor signal transduction histidine kinase [Polaromonas sp.]
MPHGLPLQAALINAQEALEKIQNLFSMASRISDQIAWQVDLSNFQLIWSEDLRALYHLPPGDPPGVEETIGFFAPEHQAPIRALFENCIATGAPFDKEVQIVTSTGQRIWMRVLGEASRAPSGEIRWIQGVTQNIEQQKQAEARERTLAHRLATTLESVSDAFFLVNDRWEFVFLNRQTENITKRGSADFLGKNLWEVFPEAVGSEIETHYRRAVEQRVTVRFETFFAPLESWLEISAHPTDDGLAVYFRDITQKRVDAEQLQLLQTAVSKLNDIVIITDANSVSEDGACIVFVNDAFVKRTGYARAEVLGKSSRIFTGPSSNAAELDRIRSALQQQQSVRAEMIHYTKSGEEMWVELMVAPMVSEAGSVTHFVTVERDISERKQAEAQILTLNADLERRVQARTAELERTTADLQMLSYSLAHDLRQPLIAMSGYSHLLQKQVQGVQAARYLERISAGIHEINTRADALLYFANLSRLPLQRKDIDLGGIARRRIDKLLAGEPARQVSAVIQPGLMASADPDLMEQVMQELLDNAWRSSASQQRALLEVGSGTGTDGQTAYFVRDNGEGFDMAYVNSLFEPFQKLDLTEAHAG